MRVHRVLAVAIALLFMSEDEGYGSVWPAPLSWLEFILYHPTPWKFRPFDHIVAVCLFLALRTPDGKGPRVKPMRTALFVAGATIVIWFGYGVARGGSAYQASFQTYLPMSGIFLAFAIGAVFRTVEHFVVLAKGLLAAAAYRATMCWAFYLFHVRSLPLGVSVEFITSHDDTVLWVGCILLLILRILWAPTMAARAKALLFIVFLVGAVQFNHRRLAWISLAMGLTLLFFLLPPGKYKRRATRTLWVVAPVMALYVLVGWGRTESIFRPLASFSTVSNEEDTSTRARNMENLGLIATSNYSGLLMGTGWGHPYVEVSSKYSIASIFQQWQYLPHNSMLGILAFTGVLGFFGYWLPFPTAMFLNARIARRGTGPLVRQAGIIGAVQLIVCANQYYGDLGLASPRCVYMLSMSYALALRLPIVASVWPAPHRANRPRVSPPRPAQEGLALEGTGPSGGGPGV